MVIGIDGNEANVEKPVGVSVYTLNLLKNFKEKADENTRFIVFLRNTPKPGLPISNQFFQYQVIPGPYLWSQIFLPLRLYYKRDIDIFFSPAHYSPRFCPVPTVVTIHDLSYFYYPDEFLKKDLYQLTKWTKYSLEKANHIIAVSKTTKKDLLRFYPLTDTSVDVVYNGYENRSDSKDTNLGYQLKPKKFILYVGTLQPRKNLITLIRAFEKTVKTKPDLKLVIAGKKGWLYEQIFSEVKKLNITESVIFTGFISDDEITKLYKCALFFVHPSLYEGFGIPILEAMVNNCPVVASFASSLPEIGGEACLYFDPESSDDLAEKMVRLINDPLIRQDLVKKGLTRIKNFSWKQCATDTLNIIKSTYDKSHS